MIVRVRHGRFNDVASLREQALKNGIQYPWLEEPAGYAELAKGNSERALTHFKTLEASGQKLSSGVHFRASQEGIAEVALYQGKVDDARRQIIAALQTSSPPYGKASYFLYLAQIDALNGRSADAKQEVEVAIQTSESADLAIADSKVARFQSSDFEHASRAIAELWTEPRST
jgi:hypothetical protein